MTYSGHMLLRFDAFELDELRCLLRRNGEVITVQRQVYETLRYMARNPQRLVTRDELLSEAWQGTTVSDAALSQAIKEVRRVLGDSAIKPRIIATVRGRGFRFICPVTRGQQAGVTPDVPAADRRVQQPAALTTPSNIFVGRKGSLEQLLSYGISTPPGQLVLLTGAPGVGKSRLVNEFTKAMQQQACVLVSRCWEQVDAPPLWPWPSIIGSCARELEHSALQEAIADSPTELAKLIPELMDGAPPPTAQGDITQENRFRLLDASSRFLHRAARHKPLVIVVEDVHAADDGSLLMLDFLARRLSESPLLVVVTCRELEAMQRPVLHSLLSGSAPYVSTLGLEGLSKAEVCTWVMSWTHSSPPHDLLDALYETTAGNPFLVENCLRLMITGEPLASSKAAATPALPEHIAGGIRARLALLPEVTLRTLRTSSVLGVEFSFSQLSDLTGMAADSLLAALEPAIAGRFIDFWADAQRLRFTHVIIRETLYRDLPVAERLRWHAAVAETIDRRQSGYCPSLVEAAHHSLLAVPLIAPEAAAARAIEAADEAMHGLAFDAAASFYARAETTLSSLGTLPRQRIDLLFRLAKATAKAGRPSEAGAIYLRVVNLSRSIRCPKGFAQALIRWFMDLREQVVTDEQFQAALLEALPRAKADSAEYPQLLAIRVLGTIFTASTAIRLRWIEEALAAARASDDPEVQATVISAVALSNLLAAERSLELAAELSALAPRLRQSPPLDRGWWQASSLLELGRGEDFCDEVDRCTDTARLYRCPTMGWQAEFLRSTRAFLRGDVDEAIARTRAAFSLSRNTPGPVVPLAVFGCQLLHYAWEKDDNDAAEPLEEVLAVAQSMLSAAPEFLPWRVARALVLLRLKGERDAAHVLLSNLVTSGLRHVPEDRNLLSLLTTFARLAWTLDDREAMARLQPLVAKRADLHVVIAGGGAYAGPATFYLGKLTLAQGDVDGAIVWFEQAVAGAESASSETWKAWSRWGLAQALACSRRLGHHEAALRALRLAESAATSYSLSALASEIRASGLLGKDPIRNHLSPESVDALASKAPFGPGPKRDSEALTLPQR